MSLTATRPDARRAVVHSADPADFALPTGREEEWRFTPLDRLRGLDRADPAEPVDGEVTITVDAPAQVGVETVKRDDPRVGRALIPSDRVAAVAFAAAPQATVVTVPAGAALDAPVRIDIHGEGRGYGHLAVDVGAHARALVIIDNGGGGTVAANLELTVGEGAQVQTVLVDEWDRTAVFAGETALLVGRDARLRLVTVTLGGELVRRTLTTRYAGPGGDVELLGLYVAGAGQHVEHRLLVDHAEPNCRSRVTYKGALAGAEAHSVWVGDVLIRPGATGTDTYELNRNLLLTDGTRADSIPDLEIETGEVVHAGHASATGRFDDEQLFYLMARGIPEAEARRLVVHGFFAEILAGVDDEPLRDRLLAALTAELSA